jgi:hypothetical protein
MMKEPPKAVAAILRFESAFDASLKFIRAGWMCGVASQNRADGGANLAATAYLFNDIPKAFSQEDIGQINVTRSFGRNLHSGQQLQDKVALSVKIRMWQPQPRLTAAAVQSE